MNNERRALRGNNSTFVALKNIPRDIGSDAVFTHEQQERRELGKRKAPEYCQNFKFEFFIDGKKTVWNKGQFLQQIKNLDRVVEVVKLTEDPNLTGGEEKEVELAFRMTGCGNDKNFQLTHVYWA